MARESHCPHFLLMENLFVAPDGWMQFHLTRSHQGPQDLLVWLAYLPDKQAPQHLRLPGCQCVQWFSVERFYDIASEAQRVALMREIYICRCFGEFVE